jgi:hypothetical protein
MNDRLQYWIEDYRGFVIEGGPVHGYSVHLPDSEFGVSASSFVDGRCVVDRLLSSGGSPFEAMSSLAAKLASCGLAPASVMSDRALALLERVRSVLVSSVYPDHAKSAQLLAAELLRGAGFSVVLEVFVPDRGDGSPGRLDLVARCDDGSVAIELDAVRPRRKSLFKLRQFDGLRVVCLRGRSCSVPVGIDAVVCLPLVERERSPAAGRLRRRSV